MVLMTPKPVIEKIERVVWQGLREEFGDRFNFGPVMVFPRIDPFDEERVYIYVVYDKDENGSPEWIAGLIGYVQENVPPQEMPNMPFVMFISRPGWEQVNRAEVEPWTHASS